MDLPVLIVLTIVLGSCELAATVVLLTILFLLNQTSQILPAPVWYHYISVVSEGSKPEDFVATFLGPPGRIDQRLQTQQ